MLVSVVVIELDPLVDAVLLMVDVSLLDSDEFAVEDSVEPTEVVTELVTEYEAVEL